MKKRLLCTLICVVMLLGMFPALPLVAETATGILTEEEIANLPLASTAAKNDGIRAYKIDSVDELIAAAASTFVGTALKVSGDSYTSASSYIHEKFVETATFDRGDLSTYDTIYITQDLDIAAWEETTGNTFADVYDGFNKHAKLYTTPSFILDGQNHTISGFTDTHPLIYGNMLGTIKNLKMTGASVVAAGYNGGTSYYASAVLCKGTEIGGIVFENVHMDNCHLSTIKSPAGLFIPYPNNANRNVTFMNCSINRSSVTSTAASANGIGLFVGQFGGTNFKAYNCVAANSTVIVPTIKAASDGSAFLFGNLDNGDVIKTAVMDNVASINNTFITGNTTAVGIIATFGNAQNITASATNVYAVGNVTKTTADGASVDLTNLFVDADNLLKTFTVSEVTTDTAVTMALNKAEASGDTAVNTGASSNLTVDTAMGLMNGNTALTDSDYLNWSVSNTAVTTTSTPAYVATFETEGDTLHFLADSTGKITFTQEQKELLSANTYYNGAQPAAIDYDGLVITNHVTYTLNPAVLNSLTFSAARQDYAQFSACTAIPETVEVWVNIPKDYTARNMIVGGYGKTGKGSTEIFWSLEMNAGGTLRWWEEATGKEMKYCKFDGTYNDAIYINTGEWMLISIVRDQVNNKILVYINGELAAESRKVYTANKTSGTNVFDYTTGKTTTDAPRLGRDWRETLMSATDNNLLFEGSIHQLRMYSDDRTAEEIAAGYANDRLFDQKTTSHLQDNNLYGCWEFHELAQDQQYPLTFNNLATGSGAADLSISTVWFGREEIVAPNYNVTYPNASGIQFPDSTHQLRMEEELTEIPLTFSALINLDEDDKGILAGNRYSAGSYSEGAGRFVWAVNADGVPFLQWMAPSSNSRKTYYAHGIDLQGQGWLLLTAAFDPELDVVYWYINGSLVEISFDATVTPSIPYQRVKIGGDYLFTLDSTANTSTYNTSYFTGKIGYTGIWSTVRTAQEVAAESAALQADATAVPTTGNGLLGSWCFAGDGDVLTTVYPDRSANGNDVTPFCELLKDYDQAYLESQNIDSEIAQGDYSILLMPDIQNITRDYMGGMSEYLDDYLQWIVDNQEKYNILAYVNMGDLVQDDSGTATDEWETVQAAFASTLEKAGIPGVPMRGNHDRSAYYNQYIDYDYYTSQEWFGGVYEEGYLDNSYWFIETEDVDRKYLVFSLGWSAASAANANKNGLGDPDNAAETKVGDDAELMAWVNEIIAQYPDYNVLFTAHNGMNYYGEWNVNGANLYSNILSQHNNIALSAYGHIHSPVVVERTDPRKDGVEFPSLLVDGQGIDQYEGCKGFVAMLTFHYDSDEATVNWYSVRDGSLYRVESQYNITVPHVNPHIHRYNEQTDDGYACICGATNTEKTVALIGNTSYPSVQDAVANAQSGDTVTLQVNAEEAGQTLSLNTGITLDLNGNNLTVNALFADGAVTDSADGAGKLVAGTLQLSPNNPQLALYNGSAYQLFNSQVTSDGQVTVNENAVRFGYRLNFTNPEAYALLQNNNATAAGLDYRVTLTQGTTNITYVFTPELITRYANYKLNGSNPAFTLMVTGLDSLTAGDLLTTVPAATASGVEMAGTANDYTR